MNTSPVDRATFPSSQGRKVASLPRSRPLLCCTRLVLAFLVLGIAVLISYDPVGAQGSSGASQWSQAEVIAQTDYGIHNPYLAADSSGMVHLVWRGAYDGDDLSLGQSIHYAGFVNGKWTVSTDIVAERTVGPGTIAVAGERIYLTYNGPPAQDLTVRTADALGAGNAWSWENLQRLAQANSFSQIVVDHRNQIHLVFPDKTSNGVSYITVQPGLGWTNPQVVAAPSSRQFAADWARIAVSQDGRLHVVWSEYRLPDGWPPVGVFYSRSTDSGQTWTIPIQLVEGGYNQAGIAVDAAGRIHVAWNGMASVGGRYHRVSDDGGQDWSDIESVISPERSGSGSEGPPQIATDSAGTVHMITTFDACAWHLSWQDGIWSDPECLTPSAARETGYVEEPAMTIAQGNQIHVVFWDDRNRLWHTWRLLDAPASVVKPSPPASTVASGNPEIEKPLDTLSMTSDDARPLSDYEDLVTDKQKPSGVDAIGLGRILAISAASVVFVVGAVIAVRLR